MSTGHRPQHGWIYGCSHPVLLATAPRRGDQLQQHLVPVPVLAKGRKNSSESTEGCWMAPGERCPDGAAEPILLSQPPALEEPLWPWASLVLGKLQNHTDRAKQKWVGALSGCLEDVREVDRRQGGQWWRKASVLSVNTRSNDKHLWVMQRQTLIFTLSHLVWL